MVLQGEHLPSSLLSPLNAGIVLAIPPEPPLLAERGTARPRRFLPVLLRTALAHHLAFH